MQNTNYKYEGVDRCAGETFQGFLLMGKISGKKLFTNLLQEKYFSYKPAVCTQDTFKKNLLIRKEALIQNIHK